MAVPTVVRLLGRPRVDLDGVPAAAPRGRKVWALLAYLYLADRPVSRRELAELLFPEAADPFATLRWTLAELRRSLGGAITVGGDPVSLTLAQDVVVDVDVMSTRGAPTALPGGGVTGDLGDLLDGADLDGCPVYESWLIAMRHRISATVEAWLRQRVTEQLAGGHVEEAVGSANALVARNPYDEGNHELLVRSLAAAGDRPAALRQVALCTDLFRRELGVAVAPARGDAGDTAPATGPAHARAGRAAVASDLEAGRAAIAAGAVDAGVQCLRRAAADADDLDDTDLQAQVLLALGTALVHAVRGRDEEGSLVLHRALLAAADCGERPVGLAAQRELGFVEVQAGRRRTAERWLRKAQQLAATDAEHASVLAIRGMNASDAGDYPTALAHLGESVERARACGDHRQQAWSRSILARAHLLRGEDAYAGLELTASLDLVREQRWVAFQPWPQALRAELHLLAGDVAAAEYQFEQAWALACRLGDPCWEGMAARGLGLVRQRTGDGAGADRWLAEAVTRATRARDRYQWVHAYALDAAAGAAVTRGDRARAEQLTATLLELAARCDMREMVARAHLHRHRLGEADGLAAARLAADAIDNPALRRELETA